VTIYFFFKTKIDATVGGPETEQIPSFQQSAQLFFMTRSYKLAAD